MAGRRNRRFLRLPRSAQRIRADIEEEIRFDIDMRARDLVSQGLSPDAARSRAMAEFGDLEATRRYCEEVDMESSTPRRILIVAYRTAGTPGLLDEVRSRATHERCRFVLLVPRPYWDPETEEAALTLELAIPLLEEAAGGHVEGLIGDTDPLVAVRETLEREPFDEVIVSTLPARVSHWLHRDLPSRVEQLGVSVTVVTARTSSRRLLTER